MGGPIWLGGVASEVEWVPWGVVLFLGPANHPQLLAGVQTPQALAAGKLCFGSQLPEQKRPHSRPASFWFSVN